MARALVLKGNASPDEGENEKWQTFHVSALSIASCIGRILIGIIPFRLLSSQGSNFLLDRCNSGLWKPQRNQACLVSFCSRCVFPHLSAGCPSRPRHRTPEVRSHFGRDFVRWGVRTTTDHHHRMVWNGSVRSLGFMGSQELTLRSPLLRELGSRLPISSHIGEHFLHDLWEDF